MPPRGRRRDTRASVSESATPVVAQWRRIVDAVDARPDETFTAPSPLPGWTIGDLVMHVSRSAAALVEALEALDALDALDVPTPAARRPGTAHRAGPASDLVTATGYLTGVGARARAVASTARALAADRPPGEIRAWLAREVSAAATALDRSPGSSPSPGSGSEPDPVVPTPGGPMRLVEFLRTRAVEAVVHGLDLGVEPERGAVKAVTKVFAEMFVARAPGRSVELRIPPFSAVQIVEGPRHTRGTPPNVVEADPVAFVLVVAGRMAWADAVADGRIRASGERADLSAYLPLLR